MSMMSDSFDSQEAQLWKQAADAPTLTPPRLLLGKLRRGACQEAQSTREKLTRSEKPKSSLEERGE